MKRGGPLKRKTPMPRGKGFQRPTRETRNPNEPAWGEKPRKPLNRVSKKNSRPGIDEAFRKAYCLRPENELDELLRFFPCHGGRFWVPLDESEFSTGLHFGAVGTDPHHIFGGVFGKASNRFDKDWNLVHVCRIVHLFADRFQADAAVLAITVKKRKGEWNLEQAREMLRFDPIGWLSGKPPKFDWIKPYWQALIGGGE